MDEQPPPPEHTIAYWDARLLAAQNHHYATAAARRDFLVSRKKEERRADRAAKTAERSALKDYKQAQKEEDRADLDRRVALERQLRQDRLAAYRPKTPKERLAERLARVMRRIDGEMVPLTHEDVREVRGRLDTKEDADLIAASFRVPLPLIERIRDTPLPPSDRRVGRRPVLTDDEVRAVRASKEHKEILAARYGVVVGYIQLIRNRHARGDVPDHPGADTLYSWTPDPKPKPTPPPEPPSPS